MAGDAGEESQREGKSLLLLGSSNCNLIESYFDGDRQTKKGKVVCWFFIIYENSCLILVGYQTIDVSICDFRG